MSKRSNRKALARLMPVVGHVYKTFTTEKWARQYVRRGKGGIVDGVLYCYRSGYTDWTDPTPRIIGPRVQDPITSTGAVEYRFKPSAGYAMFQADRTDGKVIP